MYDFGIQIQYKAALQQKLSSIFGIYQNKAAIPGNYLSRYHHKDTRIQSTQEFYCCNNYTVASFTEKLKQTSKAKTKYN